jgi:hypothetical protein
LCDVLCLFHFVVVILCVSQQGEGEFKNTIANWKKADQKLFIKQQQLSIVQQQGNRTCFLPFFYRVFSRFYACGAQKHHRNIFSKTP